MRIRHGWKACPDTKQSYLALCRELHQQLQALAAYAIDSGHARQRLQLLVEFTAKG